MIVACLFAVSRASACSVCFGDPNDVATHASNAAIITLGSTGSVVLLGLGAIVLHIVRSGKGGPL